MLPLLFFACVALPAAPVSPPPSGQEGLLAGAAPDPALRPGEPGLTYELYVRSFQDSDGDGIGDLEGVRQRLEYLGSLGVRTLWLMPVFPAFGPAGYDATDFDTITPEYGTEGDLEALLDEAHQRGIRVLLDVPFNHVHRSHPWFVAAEAGDAPARARFRYSDDAAGADWYRSQAGGAYFAWFGPDMPDLDWHHADTRARMMASLDHWLNVGVDGFRFDAVLMLEEGGEMELGTAASRWLLGDLVTELRADHPEAFFLAEASEWEVASSLEWLDSEGAPGSDAVLDFPRLDALEEAALGHGSADLPALIREQVEAGGVRGMGAFLGSHDLSRLPSRVAAPAARRALRVLQFLLPGSPVLYYGEELDLADASTATGQDHAMRAPMPWTAASQAGFTTGTPWFTPDPAFESGQNVAAEDEDPASMLSLVRELSAIRMACGLDGATDGWLDPASELLHFRRDCGGRTLEVWVNLSGEAAGGLPPWGWRYA